MELKTKSTIKPISNKTKEVTFTSVAPSFRKVLVGVVSRPPAREMKGSSD